MCCAIHQPRDIKVYDGPSEVGNPQCDPRVLVPSINRHDRWQTKREDGVEDFVMPAKRN